MARLCAELADPRGRTHHIGHLIQRLRRISLQLALLRLLAALNLDILWLVGHRGCVLGT